MFPGRKDRGIWQKKILEDEKNVTDASWAGCSSLARVGEAGMRGSVANWLDEDLREKAPGLASARPVFGINRFNVQNLATHLKRKHESCRKIMGDKEEKIERHQEKYVHTQVTNKHNNKYVLEKFSHFFCFVFVFTLLGARRKVEQETEVHFWYALLPSLPSVPITPAYIDVDLYEGSLFLRPQRMERNQPEVTVDQQSL